MSARIPHSVYSTGFGVVYVGLVANLLTAVASLPLLVLLVVTDPARSWPAIAVAGVLAAPAPVAAFSAFRAHGLGGAGPFRSFAAGYRRTWRKAFAIGAMTVGAIVVLLVDVRALATATAGVVVVPLLLVLAGLVLATALVALVALAEAPDTRLRDILRVSVVLAVRRWYLTLVSLAIIAVQIAVFVNLPAIGVGVTAAAALYLAWANSRYTLRPVLPASEPVAH